MKTKFFVCSHCGNIVTLVKNTGVPLMCCGEKMVELIPNTVDASGEKHIPVAKLADDVLTVNVGSVDHPMLPEHFIQWVCVETENGFQLKYLQPGKAPNVSFNLGGEKAVAVYEYCNLHGLWMLEL